MPTNRNLFISIIATSLQLQLSLAAGFLFTLIVSYFYYFVNDLRFPQEKPEYIWAGLILSMVAFVVGKMMETKWSAHDTPKNIRSGAAIVVVAWLIGCTISAIVFVLAGFPDPLNMGDYSLFRRFTDAFYESMSGFTTAGGSILPNVEIFPRGILMWRSVTHFIGGMGIAYMAILMIKNIRFNREIVVNSESEGPNYTTFENDSDVETAGRDFFKTYSLITAVLCILLLFSGMFFREKPYKTWYDNAYDAVNHSFSVMGTGGFGTYNLSIGLREFDGKGNEAIGGLSNPTSEWIIAIFMIIAGSNMGLWYVFFSKEMVELSGKAPSLKRISPSCLALRLRSGSS